MQQQYAIQNPLEFGATARIAGGSRQATVRARRRAEITGVERHFYDYEARGVPYGPGRWHHRALGAVASLPFAPEIVLPRMQHINETYPGMTSEYGFKCSFNPTFIGREHRPSEGWISNGYYGLDQGPIVMMIENYRTGFLWRLLHQCPAIRLVCASSIYRRSTITGHDGRE